MESPNPNHPSDDSPVADNQRLIDGDGEAAAASGARPVARSSIEVGEFDDDDGPFQVSSPLIGIGD